MEKTNVAELLKDCPKGMELDCTMFDNVTFVRVNTGQEFPIEIKVGCITKYLTKEGCYHRLDCIPSAKCVIFPKGKTTWEGFQRPFKDGDILAYQFPSSPNPSIYIHKYSQELNTAFYVALSGNGDFKVRHENGEALYGNDSSARLATEEEKQKLFDAIKANGYKWNPDTKTLEKLIEPKFKVGDRITNGKVSITIGYIDDNYYYETGRKLIQRVPIKNQDDWKLDKFDITTLKPFESRVLVRYNKDNKWCGAFFSHIDAEHHTHSYKYVTTAVKSYPYCIPFEGNEHLIGKTYDCDDFYKIWE